MFSTKAQRAKWSDSGAKLIAINQTADSHRHQGFSGNALKKLNIQEQSVSDTMYDQSDFNDCFVGPIGNIIPFPADIFNTTEGNLCLLSAAKTRQENSSVCLQSASIAVDENYELCHRPFEYPGHLRCSNRPSLRIWFILRFIIRKVCTAAGSGTGLQRQYVRPWLITESETPICRINYEEAMIISAWREIRAAIRMLSGKSEISGL